PMGLQQRHKARHVRAFFMRRKCNSQLPVSNGRLSLVASGDNHRMPDAAHTHSLNGNMADVHAALHIRHRDDRISDSIHFSSLIPQRLCPLSCTTLPAPNWLPQRDWTDFTIPAASRPSSLRMVAWSP